MEGGKGVVGIRDLFRWVGDGRESSSGQKGGGTKDLAVLELLFPGPWVTGGGRDERPRRSPFELRYEMHVRQTDREERKVNKIQGEKKKSRSQGRHPAATHSKNELHKQRASEAGLEV